MGFLGELIGQGPSSQVAASVTFFDSLPENIQEVVVYQVNCVHSAIRSHVSRDGIESLLTPTACVFVYQGTDIGECRIAGNPKLFRKTGDKRSIGALVYLCNLKGFGVLQRNPGDPNALYYIAAEATVRLLSGCVDRPGETS